MMNELRKSYPVYLVACISLLLLALIILLMVVGRELLIPLTIAFLFTFLLLPVSKRLESFHVPRGVAIFISIMLAIVVLGGFVYFLYTQLLSFIDDTADLKIKISQKIDSIQRFIREHFNVSKIEQTQWLDKKISDALDQGDEFLIAFFTTTGTFITNLLLIPLYIYFLTLYRDKIKNFIALVANGKDEPAFLIISKVLRVAQKYLKGLMVDMTIVAILLSAGFLLLGVKHALLFGLLVATCNVILPYMGITIGSIFPFFMMIITEDSFGPAVGVFGFCAFMQFVDNHFVNPYVVGSSVSINPLTAFIGLVASAMIWGVYGMLLCIPVMGMIKVVCDNIPALKPYGFIIGQEMEFGQDMEKKKKRLAHKIIGRTKKK